MPKKVAAPPKKQVKNKPVSKPLTELHGQCGCGSVRFTVKGPLEDVEWCHCSKCQRFHGGPGAYATAPRGAMSFQRRDGLAWWDSSPTVQRGFCRQCGSSMLFSDSNASTISICAGVLVGPTGLSSDLHIFVGSKPDWYEVKDGVPQRDTI